MSYVYRHNFRFAGEFSEWLHHPEDEKSQEILEINVFNDEDLIAKAFFGYLSESRGSHLACLEIFVQEDYRRQKVATKIYDLAESIYNDTCKPYPGNSESSQAFWTNRR